MHGSNLHCSFDLNEGITPSVNHPSCVCVCVGYNDRLDTHTEFRACVNLMTARVRETERVRDREKGRNRKVTVDSREKTAVPL